VLKFPDTEPLIDSFFNGTLQLQDIGYTFVDTPKGPKVTFEEPVAAPASVSCSEEVSIKVEDDSKVSRCNIWVLEQWRCLQNYRLPPMPPISPRPRMLQRSVQYLGLGRMEVLTQLQTASKAEESTDGDENAKVSTISGSWISELMRLQTTLLPDGCQLHMSMWAPENYKKRIAMAAKPAPVVTKSAPVVTKPAPIVTKPAPVVINPAPIVAKSVPVAAKVVKSAQNLDQ